MKQLNQRGEGFFIHLIIILLFAGIAWLVWRAFAEKTKVSETTGVQQTEEDNEAQHLSNHCNLLKISTGL